MKYRMALTAEASDHKVVGLIAGEAAAHELAAAVRAGTGLKEAQVRVLSPGDTDIGRTLEPESRGILHTIIRAHMWLALTGAAVGILASGIMIALGVQFIVLSPGWSALLLIGFGTIGGLTCACQVCAIAHSDWIATRAAGTASA